MDQFKCACGWVYTVARRDAGGQAVIEFSIRDGQGSVEIYTRCGGCGRNLQRQWWEIKLAVWTAWAKGRGGPGGAE